jgi:hypothetical protein
LVLVYSIIATSALAWIVSWRAFPPSASLALLLIAIAAALSEGFGVLLPPYSFSLAYPLGMAATIYFGPTAGALVAAVSSVNLEDFREHMPAPVMACNVALLSLVTMAGGWTYIALGGRLLSTGVGSAANPLGVSDFPSILVPLLAAAVACAVGNDVLAGIAMGLRRGTSVWDSVRAVLWLIPSQVALAFVGYLVAQALAISLIALPLFIAPFVVASQLYQRYAALKDAYADTVRSLVGALEAKDPYTRGHSERVAAYALDIGRAGGLDARSLERLEYAALLHDLGKLAVPGEVLTKPGKLTDAEMLAIREHPERGAAMVSRIPPLKDLAEYVRKHHEWFGGGGYPAESSVSDIPELARMLSVADCYDAMTTTRAYRPAMNRDAAIAELIRYAGTQFDPEVVRMFIEARIGLMEVSTAIADHAESRAASVAGDSG